jgi:hypothetical protein
MTSMKKNILNGLLLVGLCVGGVGCRVGGALCSEEMKHEVTSLDGKYVATLFERNCGATTDFVTHINLRPSEAKYRAESSGNVIDGEIFVVDGRPEITLIWTEAKTLSILSKLEVDSRGIFKQEASWQDVIIRYVSK